MSNQKPKFPQLDFTTGVGRLVSGSVSVASDKGYNGVKREVPQYFFAFALPKSDPGAVPLLQKIQNHAWTSYAATPHAAAVHAKITHGGIGSVFPPGIQAPFAWKIEDGDAPDNAQREGWAGHWVFKFSGTFPVNCANAQNQQLDPRAVQLGAWVQMAASVEINGNGDHTAGIYMNYRCVRVIDNGVLIVPGPNAATLFGDAVPPLPPGAVTAGSTPGAPPAAPVPAAYGQQPPQQPPAVGNYTPPPVGAPAPTAPAGAVPAPAMHQQPGAPGVPPTYPAGYPGTVYPSNPGNVAPPVVGYGTPGQAPGYAPPPAANPGYPAPQGYPGVQPHPGFLNPGQQQ